MFRCTNCGRTFYEEELFMEYDDPSPSGISLPSSAYSYAYCPHCGEGIGLSDRFSLFDAIDIEEGAEDYEVFVTLEGKGVRLYIDEDGNLDFEAYTAPKKEKEVKNDVA